jgi:hypothetical protein
MVRPHVPDDCVSTDFVCDGHHRISVARALGQQDIEAEVMVWQVTGPLPWERSAIAHNPTGQETEIGRLSLLSSQSVAKIGQEVRV